MSGGSFDYLYRKDCPGVEDLQRMAEALAEASGDGFEHALEDTRELAEILEQVRNHSDELRRVWRTVEWWKSNDYGLDQVHEALADYEKLRRPTLFG